VDLEKFVDVSPGVDHARVITIQEGPDRLKSQPGTLRQEPGEDVTDDYDGPDPGPTSDRLGRDAHHSRELHQETRETIKVSVYSDGQGPPTGIGVGLHPILSGGLFHMIADQLPELREVQDVTAPGALHRRVVLCVTDRKLQEKLAPIIPEIINTRE